MEKFSQFRDKGTGIAPFLPVPPPATSALYLPFQVFLLAIRIPLLLSIALVYLLVVQFLPVGPLIRKATLWCLLGVPGIWLVDLQIDGVRRGSLSQHRVSATGKTPSSFPSPTTSNSIIAASHTSPLDVLYLAAIFDPVFVACYPSTTRVEVLSLLSATIRPLTSTALSAVPSSGITTTLADVAAQHPTRAIVLFPETTATNGRAVLPLSHALTAAPHSALVYPTSLRYTPADVTTPLPGLQAAWSFIWNLCSRTTHTIRLRVAEPIAMASTGLTVKTSGAAGVNGVGGVDSDVSGEGDEGEDAERRLLDRTGEALARLGRVKRVGLGVRDKAEFVKVWSKRRNK